MKKSPPSNPQNEKGATMIEYVFLVTLMSVACIASVGLMRDGVEKKFDQAGRSILGHGQVEEPPVLPP